MLSIIPYLSELPEGAQPSIVPTKTQILTYWVQARYMALPPMTLLTAASLTHKLWEQRKEKK